ncbi:MAG: leader peptidase (prepilin peptidase) / N-methyltransferase [Sphingomonadales bacterium]|jgi:prepilin signal peptidase PulO-like enzyme (type II secretory pathway)|nr:leader peptidase (prepilin peptidase) / N-methyltransferase [Sphingomonadales bacterium]
MLDPAKVAMAFGFVLGVGAGGALAARARGRSLVAGRRCGACGESLSLWPAAPFLSWFGVSPQCRRCGTASDWLHPALEAAVVLIGLIAIFVLPLPLALVAVATGWILFPLALRRWG